MTYEVPSQLLSWEDALRLYPDTPVEIHDGVVYAREAAPFAPHQRVVGRAYQALANYLDNHPQVGEAFVSPFDVKLRVEAPAIVLQPDVLFVSAAKAGCVGECLLGAPDLAVEVVSASSVRSDLIYKRNQYARFGVAEYWIVWPEEHKLDVLRLEGDHFIDVASLGRGGTLTTPLLPGFALSVERLFGA